MAGVEPFARIVAGAVVNGGEAAARGVASREATTAVVGAAIDRIGPAAAAAARTGVGAAGATLLEQGIAPMANAAVTAARSSLEQTTARLAAARVPSAATAPGMLARLEVDVARAQLALGQAERQSGQRIAELEVGVARAEVARATTELAGARPADQVTRGAELARMQRNLAESLLATGDEPASRAAWLAAGKQYAQLASPAGGNTVVQYNNQALSAFARAGDFKGALEAVQRHGGQYMGGTADMIAQARTLPAGSAERQTVLGVARKMADAAQRVGGRQALTDAQWTTMRDGIFGRTLNTLDPASWWPR